MKITSLLMAFVTVGLAGCMAAATHRAEVQASDKDRLSVGTVQREIRVGMSSADVVQALGSPNIVTTDDERREAWVYDKIATERAYSTSSGGVNILFLAGFGSSSGAASSSQRTLTVIIKFDNQSKVRDFAYHTSSF